MKTKQARFVHEFLVDRNAAAAAVRAGYSSKTARQIGHRLLTHVDVAAAVRAGEAEIAAKAHLTREVVMNGFLEAIELARSKADAAAMIAGWREIAKLCGFYAPERREVQLSLRGQAELAGIKQMSDEELANLIAAGEEATSTENLGTEH